MPTLVICRYCLVAKNLIIKELCLFCVQNLTILYYCEYLHEISIVYLLAAGNSSGTIYKLKYT